MQFHNNTSVQLPEILHDLAMIHEDRIACYSTAIACLTTIDPKLHLELAKIISNGEYYKQRLLQKIKESNISTETESAICGKICSAWKDLKVSFSGKSQKAVIAYILYNEGLVLAAYNAALCENAALTEGCKQLIEQQEIELRKKQADIMKFNLPNFSSRPSWPIEYRL